MMFDDESEKDTMHNLPHDDEDFKDEEDEDPEKHGMHVEGEEDEAF